LKRGPDRPLNAHNAAIAGKHQRNCVIGDFVDAIIGHVAHGNTAGARNANVHGIESNAATNYHFATFSLIDEVGGQSDFVKNDDGIGMFQAPSELLILVRLKAVNLREAV
jgi:hypothetical protein